MPARQQPEPDPRDLLALDEDGLGDALLPGLQIGQAMDLLPDPGARGPDLDRGLDVPALDASQHLDALQQVGETA